MRKWIAFVEAAIPCILVLSACTSQGQITAPVSSSASISIPPTSTSSDLDVPTAADQKLPRIDREPAVRLLAWVSSNDLGMPTMDVTYQTPGGTSQSVGVIESAAKYLTAQEVGTGDFVGVTARSNQQDGSVGCKIEANGKIIASNELRAPFAEVSCSADVLELIPTAAEQT